MTERHVRDKVSKIFRILSGMGFGGHRVYTCQQRCQPSSVCRKYNMIGMWPNIGWFSHSGCCLRRMSRRLAYLMTFVCRQLALGNWRMVESDGPSGINEESWERYRRKKEVCICPPLQQWVSCIFTLWRKKKSGNWQPVFLWLSDHELLIGSLFPLSLGLGIFCYFIGPSFYMSLGSSIWGDRNL